MRTATERSREAARALGDVPTQLAALEQMTVSQLAAKYEELYGEPTRTRNRDYLKKRLAWRIQELAEGGLIPATLSKIISLGDALPERWRMRQAPASTTPTSPAGGASKRDARLPPTGTIVTRVHDGVSHSVTVLDESFEYGGERFKTLSSIARRITGTAWNGFTFFGLKSSALGGES